MAVEARGFGQHQLQQQQEEEGKSRSRTEVVIFRLLLMALLVSTVLLVGLLCYSVVGKQTEDRVIRAAAAAKAGASARALSGRLSGGPPLDYDSPIYVVTPTYNYAQQIAHLTRHLWLLATVPNLVWILIQDDEETDPYVTKYLNEQLGVIKETPFYARHSLEVVYLARGSYEGDAHRRACRGRLGRNRAFEEIYARINFPQFARGDRLESEEGLFVQKGVSRRHGLAFAEPDPQPKGWLYFLDDDNTFSPALFTEVRKIKRIGVWPVGNMAKVLTSSPLVYANNTVGAFLDAYVHRKYKMDMAGFGFNVAWMYQRAQEAKLDFYEYWQLEKCTQGGMENILLGKALDSHLEMEPLADQCSRVLVWHTQTKSIAPVKVGYRQWLYRRTPVFANAQALLDDVEHHGLKEKSLAHHPPPFLGLPAHADRIVDSTTLHAPSSEPAISSSTSNATQDHSVAAAADTV